MNLKAILVFSGSVLSLAAEVTSNHRRWLITVLSITLVTSSIPIFVSLTEFFLSPRCKWRRFKYAFYELFLDEYFPLRETDWRLQGRSVYCHQGHGKTVHCLHDSHLVVAAMSSTPESNIVDIPSDTVKNLKISFLNKAFASNAFGWSAECSLSHGGLSVFREYESALGYTYDVDLRPADTAGDHVFSQLQHEYVLMELEIDVGDLNVFFRYQ